VKDSIQTKHTLLRNFPLIGRLRWVFEHERSKIQQYFIEDDTNGTPYNREKRSDVYQKSKGDINTTPFGTQSDVYEKGYEFIKHSMYPKNINDVKDPRVIIGSKFCKKPYSASVFNISAMSYGALSDAAVRALNGGAKLGNFYHNTGEGGISPYHAENGGDLCFQIGTGYFGAGKTVDGVRYFDEDCFVKSVSLNKSVKMIEIKLSQGAKPGHGGILPASKNTQEIADIRGVQKGVDVMSPSYHTAFSDSKSMLEFVSKLRELSGGLPIGIKMCLGNESEVTDLFKTMKELDMYPDFITIDGGEGGTGAAPLVFTNSIGTPLIDALMFIKKSLKEFQLDDIKVIASGKASTSFDIIKLLSLGADVVNAARAFMLSLGCIQARECNKNTCPVGIATQNKNLVAGLNSEEKRVRVYNYHKSIIHELREVLGAMGLTSVEQLNKDNIYVRLDKNKVSTYGELFA
jgi:glutamate synthase domain-containing protein 2